MTYNGLLGSRETSSDRALRHFCSRAHCHLTYELCIYLLYLCGPSINFIIQATLKILMMMMLMICGDKLPE